MYVTGDTIIRFATVLGALGTLGALLYRSFHWMEQQKAQQAEIENIKKEQCVICYGLLATLDGLVFSVLAVTSRIDGGQFLNIFSIVIAFYFGTQHRKSMTQEVTQEKGDAE